MQRFKSMALEAGLKLEKNAHTKKILGKYLITDDKIIKAHVSIG